MKKISLIVYLTLIIPYAVFTQCLPNGISFTTQTAIDNFQINYPNCYEISGDVLIEGINISNLTGLNLLTKIDGDLTIKNTRLNNLSGLNMLDTINGVLHIQHNDSLTSLQAFENLEFVGSHFIIAHCYALLDFDGLENLTSVGEGLFIAHNYRLSNIEGLIGLNSINGGFWIDVNDSLTSLEGINNIDPLSITDIFIRDNSKLSKCNVKSICDYLPNPTGLVGIYDNSSGCKNKDQVLDSCATVGITSMVNESTYLVYPNPATNYFRITNNNNEVNEIIVYNMLGLIVLHENIMTDKIDISNLSKGTYILELVSNKIRIQKKLMVK